MSRTPHSPPSTIPSDWVSASDVSGYVFCPRYYQLDRVEHQPPTAAAAVRRREGTRRHVRFGRLYQLQRRLRGWTSWLFLLAGIGAGILVWLVYWRRVEW
jgi:hypothetical protein